MARFRIFFGAPAASAPLAIEVPSANLLLSAVAPTLAVASAPLSWQSPLGEYINEGTSGIEWMSPSGGYIVEVQPAATSPAIEVPSANLALSVVAPSVSVSGGASVSIEVPSTNLALSAVAPSITLTASFSIAIPSANLALSGFALSVSITTGALKHYLRPDADILDGGWLTNTGSSDLAPVLDEATAIDSDYAISSPEPDSDIFEVRLRGPVGGITTPYKVRYRYDRTVGAGLSLIVSLMQGSTTVATWVHADIAAGTIIEADQPLSDAQAALVTDTSDLRLRFHATTLPQSDLVAWYKHAYGITSSIASLVGQWDDISGNANHLVQSTTTNKPSHEADHAIRFDGADNFIKDAFTLDQPCTIYAIARQITWASGRTLIDGAASTAVLRMRPTSGGGTSPQLALNAGTSDGNDGNMAVGATSVVSVVWNGAASFLGVNSNAGATLDPGTNNPGGLTLGSNSANSVPANCEFREVLVYSSAHDATTRARIVEYLYGVYEPPIPYFFDDACTQPWYANSVGQSAAYFEDTDTTWFLWEASTPAGSGGVRRVECRTFDHTTQTFSPVVVVGTNTLTNDDHGVPAILRDDNGYVYCFYGAHSDPQQLSVTTSPNDPSAWTARTAISTQIGYPHPDIIGGVIHLFGREDTVDEDRKLFVIKSTSVTGGNPTWGAKQNLVSLGPDARFYGGHHVVVGTDVHLVATRADATDTERKHVYYFVYDTVTGDVRNYDDTFSVATASQPMDLTEANTYCRLFEHTGSNEGSTPELAFDTNGHPHVIFADGAASAKPVKHIWHNGTAWQSVVDTGLVTDGGFALIPKPGGVMRLYWPWARWIKVIERSAAGVWSTERTLGRSRIGTNGYALTAPILNGGRADCEVIFADYNPGTAATEVGTLRGYGYGDNGFLPQGI